MGWCFTGGLTPARSPDPVVQREPEVGAADAVGGDHARAALATR